MPISSQLAPGSIAKPGVCTSSTRPASPYQGQVIYETDTAKTLVWNGSAWVYLSTSTANPPGLELVKTATVTNATDSGTAFRSIFTSSYTSYRIFCSTITALSNGAQPRVSFYYSTSTEQTTTYYSAFAAPKYDGTTSVVAVNNGSYINLASECDSIGASGFVLDVLNIGTSTRAAIQGTFTNAYNSQFCSGGGLVATNRTYDGLRFFMSVGNISMTASVYGYKV